MNAHINHAIHESWTFDLFGGTHHGSLSIKFADWITLYTLLCEYHAPDIERYWTWGEGDVIHVPETVARQWADCLASVRDNPQSIHIQGDNAKRVLLASVHKM